MVISMNNSKGFTLVEVLAIVIVLALLTLISVPLVVNYVNKARNFTNEQTLKQAEDSAINYAMENSKLLADNPKSTFITNGCAINYTLDSSNYSNIQNSCIRLVSIQTLINEGYYKDDASKLKKDGNVIIYKYKGNKKTTSECQSSELDSCYNFEIKAYADKSLLN